MEINYAFIDYNRIYNQPVVWGIGETREEARENTLALMEQENIGKYWKYDKEKDVFTDAIGGVIQCKRVREVV